VDTNASEPFRIGLVGPSGVGKTSLITALLAESMKLLTGTGVAMHPVGTATEERIARNQRSLDANLLSEEFEAMPLGFMHGSAEPFIFTLGLNPGSSDDGISIEVLDFPGLWLSPESRPARRETEWARCLEFIAASTILLIPVDATVLMEAVTEEERGAAEGLLAIAAVADVARDWAIRRQERAPEPALAVFCPVKCESYFNDNGGLDDRSGALQARFDTAYKDVINAIRVEAPGASVLYTPVDTIGCVELADVKWIKGQAVASYRVREPGPRISRAGASEIMRALCRHLAYGRRILREAERDTAAGAANAYAEHNSGFFRAVRLWLSRERRRRMRAAHETEAALTRAEALVAAVEAIAASGSGPRAQEF
jgi:hypothetical protein